MSNYPLQDRKNYEHNVFSGMKVRPGQSELFGHFLSEQDISVHTVEALISDLSKFARWFNNANKEVFDIGRVTVRDIVDFRDHLYRDRNQAVSTINRCVASLRKYFKWLSINGHISSNPTLSVKELRRQPLAPQGLERAEVRQLMREVELREDVRSKAIFSIILYTGARLNDIVNLELSDLTISKRSGSVSFRFGKGSKQRTVPLPLQARNAIEEYLKTRPPVQSQKVFLGERGPLNKRGIQSIFEKYRVLTGIENLHCHILRHTFSHHFLQQGGNLVQLAQILGHENLNTTAIYTKNTAEELSVMAEKLVY